MRCSMDIWFFVILWYVLEYEKILYEAYNIATCEENADLYFQNGEIVQVSTRGQNMSIQICKPINNDKPAEFDPLQQLQNISVLKLEGITWPFSNAASTFSVPEQVSLKGIKSFGSWGDCSRMVYLLLRLDKKNPIDLNSITPDWLANCNQLHYIVLKEVSVIDIRKIIQSALFVQVLILNINKDFHHIVQYPLFRSDRNNYQELKHLDIYGDSYQYFPTISNSSEIINWADVSSSLVWQVSLLPLKSFLIGFRLFDFCAVGNFSSVTFSSLLHLQLWNTNTQQLCLKKLRIAPQLASVDFYLNLRFPYETYKDMRLSTGIKIKVSELYSTQSPQLILNMNNQGQVLSFEFTREDFLRLSDIPRQGAMKSKVTLVGFRQVIKCDCIGPSLWLARSIRAGFVVAPGVTCKDYTKPEELKCEWIDCDRVTCNSTCVCCGEKNDSVSADCRGTKITRLPTELMRLPNLTRLLIPNNNILSLPNHLPDTLLMVDLSFNNIWHASESVVDVLFTQPKRRVRLAGNRILCSCDNELLISKLQDKSHQIEDFESITCAVTNTKLASVDFSQLCASRDLDKALIKRRETLIIVITSMLVFAATSLIVSIVLYRRRRDIQIFLFARSWCLSCVHEEDLDADRCYDVFVSFCHADTNFVLTELLPILDKDYSVCVHLRDWCPGEMIPSQIMTSVKQSRRTLVVLSRNFIRSLWGRLEFQTAHVSGLADGRVRVVMIILDDVLEKDELTPELRSYVQLNTYVRWGDQWFWEKLRYALPHHPSPRLSPICMPVDCRPREAQNHYIEMEAIEAPGDFESNAIYYS